MFSCRYCEIFKKAFVIEHLRWLLLNKKYSCKIAHHRCFTRLYIHHWDSLAKNIITISILKFLSINISLLRVNISKRLFPTKLKSSENNPLCWFDFGRVIYKYSIFIQFFHLILRKKGQNLEVCLYKREMRVRRERINELGDSSYKIFHLENMYFN